MYQCIKQIICSAYIITKSGKYRHTTGIKARTEIQPANIGIGIDAPQMKGSPRFSPDKEVGILKGPAIPTNGFIK